MGTVDVLQGVALLLATLTVALVAGVFFGFAVAVMPGLRGTDDRAFVTAMRSINTAILNGWFLGCFTGAVLLAPAAAILALFGDNRAALPWSAAGAALYVAAFVITAAGNVPLNNALASAGNPDQIDDAQVRQRFEAPWVRLHLYRTIATIASTGCLVIGVLVY